jgi:hypothetical protein
MSITAHSEGDTGSMGRLQTLVPPLAALFYPFALEGFNTSVTHIVASGASTLWRLSAVACLALAFAMPLISMLAAMYFAEIGRPTVAQLHAKPCLPSRHRPHSPSSASFSPCCTIRPGLGTSADWIPRVRFVCRQLSVDFMRAPTRSFRLNAASAAPCAKAGSV